MFVNCADYSRLKLLNFHIYILIRTGSAAISHDESRDVRRSKVSDIVVDYKQLNDRELSWARVK